jgi:arylsulfatase A-like enzyme
MKKITLAATLLLAMWSSLALASQKRKVLILGLDGMRSDALQLATAPNLDALIANGFYTYDSWCLGITVSGPSWSTIFTGVWYTKHGVTDNSYAGSKYNDFPYFPKRAKEIKPALYAAQIVDWAPMSDQVYNEGYNQKIVRATNDLAAMFTATKLQLQNPDLDVLCLHPDNIDMAGHSSGFSPSNPAYMKAITDVDTWIGKVMDEVKARPNYADEDWLILIVTDHGGIGTSHGGNSDEERHIWWVASGNNVRKYQLKASDPGSYRMPTNPVDPVKLAKAPTQADIAVTALHHLIYDSGIRPDDKSKAPGTTWNLDGKSWLDSIMIPPATGIQPAPATLDMKMYPNPTSGLVTLWFDPMGQAVSYQVTNMLGQVLKAAQHVDMGYKLNLDLGDQPAGNYIITVTAGNHTSVKQVTLTK